MLTIHSLPVVWQLLDCVRHSLGQLWPNDLTPRGLTSSDPMVYTVAEFSDAVLSRLSSCSNQLKDTPSYTSTVLAHDAFAKVHTNSTSVCG